MFPQQPYPLIAILVLLVASCTTEPYPQPPLSDTDQGAEVEVGVANPTSVFCEEQGGRSDIRGSEGYCVFDDGSECEEWAYFNEECPPGEAADAGDIDEYVLLANEGQVMSVDINSPNMDVLLAITGLTDGQPFVRSAADATSWSFTLPATQDYLIKTVSGDAPSSYSLEVMIPAWV